MADDDQHDDDTEHDDEHGASGEGENSNLKQLRQQAKRAKDLELENAGLRREMAFTEAGIPKGGTADYFRKGYDGDVTAEAIKAAAIEAGFLTDTEGASESERQGAEAMQAAATGGTGTTDSNYSEELAAATTPEQALAVMQKYGVQVDGQ